jgi:alkylhydroperoxidase/carboxymuconolactone decarboxylase family protein YurZ
VAAATAVGGEHCIKVQMEHAIKAGATKDELMETMMIGSYMAMTRSQSYAFRRLSERFPDE